MEAFPDLPPPLSEVKASLFKGLAHAARILVLEMLSGAPEVSVTELLAATGLESSNLSQHLAVLRGYQLVRAERRALQMFYSLAYPQVADLLSVARLLLNDMLRTTQEQFESTQTDPASGGMTPACREAGKGDLVRLHAVARLRARVMAVRRNRPGAPRTGAVFLRVGACRLAGPPTDRLPTNHQEPANFEQTRDSRIQ